MSVPERRFRLDYALGGLEAGPLPRGWDQHTATSVLLGGQPYWAQRVRWTFDLEGIKLAEVQVEVLIADEGPVRHPDASQLLWPAWKEDGTVHLELRRDGQEPIDLSEYLVEIQLEPTITDNGTIDDPATTVRAARLRQAVLDGTARLRQP